jgi:hypothetical protein
MLVAGFAISREQDKGSCAAYAVASEIWPSKAFIAAFGFFLNMNWASKNCIAYLIS